MRCRGVGLASVRAVGKGLCRSDISIFTQRKLGREGHGYLEEENSRQRAELVERL